MKDTEPFSTNTALGPHVFLLKLSYIIIRCHLVTLPVAVLVYLTIDVL